MRRAVIVLVLGKSGTTAGHEKIESNQCLTKSLIQHKKLATRTVSVHIARAKNAFTYWSGHDVGPLRHKFMMLEAEPMQGGLRTIVHCGRISAMVQEALRYREGGALRRAMQRRDPHRVPVIHIQTGSHKDIHHRCAAGKRQQPGIGVPTTNRHEGRILDKRIAHSSDVIADNQHLKLQQHPSILPNSDAGGVEIAAKWNRRSDPNPARQTGHTRQDAY